MLLEAPPTLYVPSPVTTEVTSISYHVFFATDPKVPSVAPSIKGLLFQVVPVSDHVVLVINFQVPPLLLPLFPLIVWMRSFAFVTACVRPLIVNLRNDKRTGELSTTNCVDVP